MTTTINEAALAAGLAALPKDSPRWMRQLVKDAVSAAAAAAAAAAGKATDAAKPFVMLDRRHIVALVTAADVMKNGAIPDCIINPFRAALQAHDNACPAAGMKPDACSDRSQCLEACGPLGKIPPATCTVHLPNGLVHACERHASTARLQASFLGTHAYMDEAPEGTPCTYCATRAGG